MATWYEVTVTEVKEYIDDKGNVTNRYDRHELYTQNVEQLYLTEVIAVVNDIKGVIDNG